MKTLNQYVQERNELAHIALEEAHKIGAKVIADGKPGVVQARGGDYYDIHHEDGTMSSHHVSKVKPAKPVTEETELHEGPSMADMRPDNISAIIKKHGKAHHIYKGDPKTTVHALGTADLKKHLGIGTSGSVHKKFSHHMDSAGFKSHWSQDSNEWVYQHK